MILVAIPIVTNTINTIDVLNGVVSGFILIAFVPVVFAMVLRLIVGKENPVIFVSVLPIIAASIAFYWFHKFPSKIFPGDSGAMALGAAYGSVAIIGGVEVVAVIAILPAIMNSFFFLSSVKRLVEHREIKSQPTIMLPDSKIISSDGSKGTCDSYAIASICKGKEREGNRRRHSNPNRVFKFPCDSHCDNDLGDHNWQVIQYQYF